MGKNTRFSIYFKCTSTHSYKKLRKSGNVENLKIIKVQKECKLISSSEVIPALLVSIEIKTQFSDNVATLVQIRNSLLKIINSKIIIIIIKINSLMD